MKKIVAVAAVALMIASCGNPNQASSTGIDTTKAVSDTTSSGSAVQLSGTTN